MSIAFYQPLVGGDFFQSHRAAWVHLLGTDAHLCSQAELCPIAEGCWGIHIHTGSIDVTAELLTMRLVFSDDALAMARANAIDVVYGLLQAVPFPCVLADISFMFL